MKYDDMLSQCFFEGQGIFVAAALQTLLPGMGFA
jgi:hypothetical protein